MYSEEQRKIIANNLKFFRKKYKEKQFDVADAIEIPESTYSEYINMKRIPTKENICKLAAHYNITEYELTDIMYDEDDIEMYTYFKKIITEFEKLFPIIEKRKIGGDHSFDEASKMHKELLNDINSDINQNEIVKKYFDSYNNYNNLDSYANIAMLLLLSKVVEANEEVSDFIDVHGFKLNEDYFDFFAKNCLLKTADEEAKEFNEKYDESIYDKYIDIIIGQLNKDKDYYDFVQYFIALQYLLGIGANYLSKEMNMLIGKELLTKICTLDNQYAKNLLTIFM